MPGPLKREQGPAPNCTSIVSVSYANLAQAVTIAVRYSAVRVQGFKDTGKDGGAEHAVLDYRSFRNKVLISFGIKH